MPDPGCERFRGLLAEDAVGRLSAAERADLDAHLAGCAGCRADAADVARATAALAWIGPSVADELVRSGGTGTEVVPTVALDAAVAGILSGRDGSAGAPTGVPGQGPSTDGRARPTGVRRTVRQRILAPAMAVAAAALVISGALTVAGGPAPVSRTVVLSGPAGAHATATLTDESWGTSMTLTDPGGRADQVLAVSMATEYGHRWDVGSYWVTLAHGATVTVACALPADQIRTIEVTDPAGHVVLAGRQPGDPPG